MGKGRTTTGMILACLAKDVLHGDPGKKYPEAQKVNEKVQHNNSFPVK